MARIEFASTDGAAALMGTEARHNVFVGGSRLRVEYDSNPGPEAGARQGAAPLDWICDMCQAVNFARRFSCYQCNTARPAAPRTVEVAAQEPSSVLRVSGLEPQTGEAEICELFNPISAIIDCRIVHDKFTGQPRGFAFLEFRSVAEAGRAMQACQGAAPPGQAGGLRISYARGRDAADASALKGFVAASHVRIGGEGVAAGPAAPAAKQEADPYAGWAPKEFDAGAAGVGGGVGGEAQQQAEGGQQQEQAPSGQDGQQHEGQHPQSQPQQQAGAGFQFDEASGYWFHAESGYYWDQATGLYYHAATNQWLAMDQETGQFTAAGGSGGAGGEQLQQAQQQPAQQQPQQQPQLPVGPQQQWPQPQPQPQQHWPQPQQQPQQQPPQPQPWQQQQPQPQPQLQQWPQPQPRQQQQQQQQQPPQPQPWQQQQPQPRPQPQQWQQPQPQPQPRPAGPAVPRSAATIGAAPQLNAQGLLTIIAVEEEREKEERRRQKLLEQRAAMQQQQHQQRQLPRPPPAAPPPPPVAGAVQGQGGVAGVVYQSTWAQRRQQMGGQR